jgi:hypothetical protein
MGLNSENFLSSSIKKKNAHHSSFNHRRTTGIDSGESFQLRIFKTDPTPELIGTPKSRL